MDATFVVVPLLVAIAPLAAQVAGRWVLVPVVVFELVLGMVFGPFGLGWAHPSTTGLNVSRLGLAMLFFVAGTEIELTALRGRTGRAATLGWLASLAIGVAAGWVVGGGQAAVIIGIALSSTALGTLLPVLRDAGELGTELGRTVVAIGTVGEFGPLIAITIFLGARDPGTSTVILGLFLTVAAGVVWYAVRAPHGALQHFVTLTMHSSGQFAIRLVMLLILGLVALSAWLSVDILLGAFTAGLVWRLLMRDASADVRAAVDSKIEGLAFGFLIPVFFVYTGVTFDLQSLVTRPALLWLVPVLAIAMIIVRGLPASFAAPRGTRWRGRLELALFGATGLPIIVAVTQTGVREHLIPAWSASVLVAAGMVSVLLFPLLAMTLRGEQDLVTQPWDDTF